MHNFRPFVGAFKRSRERAGRQARARRDCTKAINLTLTASRMAAPACGGEGESCKGEEGGREELIELKSYQAS